MLCHPPRQRHSVHWFVWRCYPKQHSGRGPPLGLGADGVVQGVRQKLLGLMSNAVADTWRGDDVRGELGARVAHVVVVGRT